MGGVRGGGAVGEGGALDEAEDVGCNVWDIMCGM